MLNPGQRLSDNTIIKKLGSGSFGAVFSTANAGHVDPVALKVCALDVQDVDKKRFAQENAILHNLKTHSQIIFPLSEILDESPYLYYLMELADCNLDEYLNANYDIVNDQTRINFFKKICDG